MSISPTNKCLADVFFEKLNVSRFESGLSVVFKIVERILSIVHRGFDTSGK